MFKKNRIPQARSTGTALANADEESLRSAFVATGHWISDLRFFNEEITFLRNVMNKYFLALIDEKNIANTRSAASRLSSLEKENVSLQTQVSAHLKRLASLMEDHLPYDTREFKEEHERLGNAVTAMMKKFTAVKQEVFKVSELAIDSEKSKHLLEH